MKQILALFIWGFTSSAFAQDIEILKDKTTAQANYCLFDVLEKKDGQLVGVGETKDAKGNAHAALFFFDETGNYSIKPFNETAQGSFRGIAQLRNGQLIAVGWTEENAGDATKAWAVWTDAQGNKLRDTTIGTKGDNRFEKVAVREDGVVVIAGHKEQIYDGSIWLVLFKNKQKVGDMTTGDGKFHDITGLVSAVGNRLLLCGNSHSFGKKSKNGDVWVQVLDSTNRLQTPKVHGIQGLWDSVWHVSQTYDENLLFSGETYSKGKGRQNAWIQEIDGSGETVVDTTFNGSKSEGTCVAAVKMPLSKFLISIMDSQKGTKELHVLDRNHDQIVNKEIEDGAKFKIQKMLHLKSAPNEFVAIGNIMGRGRASEGIRFMRLRETSAVASRSTGTKAKELPNFQCSELRLEDETGDGQIGVGESGEITFVVTNPNSNESADLKIKVSLRQPVAGFQYENSVYGGYLAPKGRKQIAIGLLATAQLTDTWATLDVVAMNGTRELCRKEIKIHCTAKVVKTGGKNTVFAWKSPDVAENNGNRSFSRNTSQQKGKLDIYTDRPLTTKDVKAYQNGVLINDSKAANMQVNTAGKAGALDISTLMLDFNLKEGLNEIVIEIEDTEGVPQKSPPIIFDYKPMKPILHLVAIGPVYTDLKYTSKDASDVVAALEKQVNEGIYRRIITHKMTTKEETTSSMIKAKFEELANSFGTDEAEAIGLNDVLMVYFSGHGKLIDRDLCLIPSDFNYKATTTTSVHFRNHVLSYLEKIKCKKIILLDACHSGSSRARADAPSAELLNQTLMQLNAAGPGLATLTSCDKDEVSFEDDEWRNGAFTKAFLEAIGGASVSLSGGKQLAADNDRDGQISLGELFAYIKNRVPDLAKGRNQMQTPISTYQSLDATLKFWLIKH